MATVFPGNLDTDLEIPRVDNNVTEVGGDTLNALRDAIFAIQSNVGVNAHGNKDSLGARVNVSLDKDGFIRSSALEGLGLLSLPVANSHVGSNAAIAESKLDLDFSTQTLSDSINSLTTTVSGISTGLDLVTNRFNTHVLGQGEYHDGYAIKFNSAGTAAVAGLTATNIGDAVNELGALLISGGNSTIAHIETDIPTIYKHVASNISVDASEFTFLSRTSSTVQEALDDLDTNSGVLGVAHLDKFHGNGVAREVNSGTNYNSSRRQVGPITGVAYTEGTSVIELPGVTSFSSSKVVTGDILEIVSQTGIADSGTYQIRAVGPLSASASLGDLPALEVDELALFHTFTESRVAGDSVVANVYKPTSESTELAPLACGARNSETIVDTISVINPDAARVVSIGFNGAILNADGYNIGVKVGIASGVYRELAITNLNSDRLGSNQADPVDSESVANRINAFVSDPTLGHHFPITAAKAGNELVIAHNLVGSDYTIEILDGYTGNYAMGMDAYGANVVGDEIKGNTSASYVVNGDENNTLRTVFDGYATITAATDTLTLWTDAGAVINPLRYGIKSGSVLHITGHATTDTNGSYTVLSANSTTVSLFAVEAIDAPSSPTRFDVLITDSHVPLTDLESTESSMGLVQVFVDETGKTFMHQRLSYGTNLGPALEVANISQTFPVGSVSLLVEKSGSFINFNLVDTALAGATQTIHNLFKGSFKLYHSNGVDYVVIKIGSGSVSGGLETLTVSDSVVLDEAMILCTAHFNGSLNITNIVDNRMFGNLGTDQARDDLVESLSQKPMSDLRSNGVVRGLDVLDITRTDPVTSMETLPLRGGVAYVNGVRLSIETQRVVIPSYDEEGVVLNDVRRIVGINDQGSLQLLSDELGEILTDGYNVSSTFGNILPLYYITMDNGGLDEIIDIRRFINNLDEKLELIVDETNNVVGNFRDLEGALLYAENYPGNEALTIKIINDVTPTNQLVVPFGVSLIGAVPYGENRHRIVNSSNYNGNFITLNGHNRVENVEIVSTTAGLQGSLLHVNADNVNIEKCIVRFDDTISNNNSDTGISINTTRDVRIVNNKIDNIYTGISCTGGCSNLYITENTISGISGIGISRGIRLGSTDRSPDNVHIRDNRIVGDSVSSTDLRGIDVDVNLAITTMRITNNDISCTLNPSNSQNFMSNGIRIANTNATGNDITQLILSDNYIKDIKLSDSNVFGIYVENLTRAKLTGNVIHNVAVYNANFTNTAMIWIGDNVDEIDISSNIMTDSATIRGIHVNNASTSTSITDNTLANVGNADCRYIYGLANRASISNNRLVGPGSIGIWWRGERSKISDNHFSTPDPDTDYSFNEAIKVQASYVDVLNNTIADMTNDSSVGIANVNSANDGLKIANNTVEGTTIGNLINLSGDYHIVANNRLKNTAASGSNTYYINLGLNADGVAITGNTFEGVGTSGIYAANQVTNVSITDNLFITTLLSGAPISMANANVANCILSGNRLPAASTYSGTMQVGPTASFGVYNQNTIGINRGWADTLGIHGSAAIPGYEASSGDGYSGIAHWTFKDENSYWEINRASSSSDRYLYFPITGLPNGSTLQTVRVQGNNTLQAGDTFTAQLLKRSVKETGLTVTALSDAVDLSVVSGEFNNSSDDGLISQLSAVDIAETVNYVESNYYVQIVHAKADTTTPTGVRIYGITVGYTH